MDAQEAIDLVKFQQDLEWLAEENSRVHEQLEQAQRERDAARADAEKWSQESLWQYSIITTQGETIDKLRQQVGVARYLLQHVVDGTDGLGSTHQLMEAWLKAQEGQNG